MQLDNIKRLANTDIRLRKSDHRYILDSNPSISFYNVTQLVEDQFPPFEREKIAKWLVNNSYKYMHYTAEELLQEWKEIKDEGAEVHKELEKYVHSRKIPRLPKARSGMNWLEQEIEVFGDKVFPEVIVFSIELKIAGTVDLLIYNSTNDKCTIFDWKTSKEINYRSERKAITRECEGLTDCKFDQYSLQLYIYSYLLENYHGIKVSNQYIVHLMESDANCIEGKNLLHNVKLILKSKT